jgi:hypothetical protein
MKTNDVLKELKSLSRRKDWSVQLRPICNIRFKSPRDKQYRHTPLAALAGHLHGKTNLKWLAAGATLELDEAQIQDFNLASETYWYRPQLRRQILKACGLEDEKFEKIYLFMEDLIGKTKLKKLLDALSSEDRFALEALTTKPERRKIEEIVRKY